MLLYKQGRFFSGAVSFALPDNCYLVIAEAMNYYENGLEITTADEEFSVAISTQHDETDSCEGMPVAFHYTIRVGCRFGGIPFFKEFLSLGCSLPCFCPSCWL